MPEIHHCEKVKGAGVKMGETLRVEPNLWTHRRLRPQRITHHLQLSSALWELHLQGKFFT